MNPLTQSELAAYLERIGYSGPLQADLPTLDGLHRAHALSIPFENLDVQLGNPPSMDPDAAFAKLVTARRGGWCYEHNGLFGRALGTLGFEATRMSGGVMRSVMGDVTLGGHLCLRVEIDGQPYLTDVGFGGTFLAPLELRELQEEQTPVPMSLGPIEDGYWRLECDMGGNAMSYDFRPEAGDEERLSEMCAFQGTNAESIFVQNLVVHKRHPGAFLVLRGKVLNRFDNSGASNRELGSAEELVSTLREEFDLNVPQAAGLWGAICERHEVVFSQQG